MGGAFFNTAGLHTPRMPRRVYEKVSAELTRKLETIFAHAGTPMEAPGKIDHGDIDIIVVSYESQPTPSVEEIATLINAMKFTQLEPKGSAHFAIPWPEDELSEVPGPSEAQQQEQNQGRDQDEDGDRDRGQEAVSAQTPTDETTRTCIQVDINIRSSMQECNLILFKHAHGDFSNIIGSTIRSYGLTLSDYGLYIRIPDLEQWDKSRSRVLVTNEPDRILKFLGLDAHRFWHRFNSYDDIMDYASTCKFFDPKRGSDRQNDRDTGFLNYADIHRLKRRAMYAYWIDVYLPAHRDASVGEYSGMSRSDVLEALRREFGSEVGEKFESQRDEGLRIINEGKLWADIRKEISVNFGVTGDNLGNVMRRLRKEIMPLPRGTESEIEHGLSEVQQDYADGDYEKVKRWALVNWENTGVAM